MGALLRGGSRRFDAELQAQHAPLLAHDTTSHARPSLTAHTTRSRSDINVYRIHNRPNGCGRARGAAAAQRKQRTKLRDLRNQRSLRPGRDTSREREDHRDNTKISIVGQFTAPFVFFHRRCAGALPHHAARVCQRWDAPRRGGCERGVVVEPRITTPGCQRTTRVRRR